MNTTTRRAAPVLDVWGKEFSIWVPNYAGIGVGAGPGRVFTPPLDPGGDLIVNGNFEQGFVRWIGTSAGDTIGLETASANVYAGTNSLKIAGLFAVDVIQTALMPTPTGAVGQLLARIIPGSTITISAVAKWLNSGNGTGYVVPWYYDAAGAYISQDLFALSWTTETTYTAKTGTSTAPASAYYAGFSVSRGSSIGSNTFWIDEIHATAPGAIISNAIGAPSAGLGRL